MDCEQATERLPWLLAGSLDAREADEVRRHLEGCAACRTELHETRQAAAVFGAHLPTAAILDLAWDRAVADADPAARAHLEACAECREDLDLARESRRLEASSEPQPASTALSLAPRSRRAWPIVTLPATLAAGLVAGVWWGGRMPDPEREAERRHTESLEDEVRRLRATPAPQSVPRAVVEPRINLPLFEIPPGSAQVRGGGAEAGHEVAIPAAAQEIVLLLSADAAPNAPSSLVLADASGAEVWRGDGLRYGPPGGYVVTLPASLLPDGPYVLTVHPAKGAAVAYHVRVRRAR